MASLRPASRILSQQLSRLTPSSTSPKAATRTTKSITFTRPGISRTNFHTLRPLLREDDNFGSGTGRRDPSQPSVDPNKRAASKDIPSNDAYPDGAPGEPKQGDSLPSGIPPSTLYTFTDIQSISSHPQSFPDKLLIDVREPSELLSTGRIPSALNIPISSAPDAFFLNAEDFEDKYGFPRPGGDKEVIFYCKAGVRSKAAARLAGQAGFGGKVGEFPGSWVEWEKCGGEVQKE